MPFNPISYIKRRIMTQPQNDTTRAFSSELCMACSAHGKELVMSSRSGVGTRDAIVGTQEPQIPFPRRRESGVRSGVFAPCLGTPLCKKVRKSLLWLDGVRTKKKDTRSGNFFAFRRWTSDGKLGCHACAPQRQPRKPKEGSRPGWTVLDRRPRHAPRHAGWVWKGRGLLWGFAGLVINDHGHLSPVPGCRHLVCRSSPTGCENRV